MSVRIPVWLAAVFVLGAFAVPPASATETKYSIVHGCFDVAGVKGGPFRLQATTLAEYLLYSKDGKFLAADGSLADGPSADTEWRASDKGNGVTRTPKAGGQARGLAGKGTGCAVYPEVEVNAAGAPRTSRPLEDATGLVDAHIHMMAFEVLGGMAHCGRP